MLHGLGFEVLVLIGGVVWCRKMVRGAGEDFRTFRETREGSEKAALATLWVITLLWGMWMVGFAVGVTRGLLKVAG